MASHEKLLSWFLKPFTKTFGKPKKFRQYQVTSGRPTRVPQGSYLLLVDVFNDRDGTDTLAARHVTVGAGSVVAGELPDFCVAVGAPARVIQRHDGDSWRRVEPASAPC